MRGKPGVPIRASGEQVLQRAHSLAGLRGSVQDGFRLRKTLHLLVEGTLARVEVVEREVAGLVQVSLLVLVLLLLVKRSSLVLLRSLLLTLARNVTAFLLQGRVRVLHEGFVRLLRIGLGLDGIGLHRLCFRDNTLEHTHDTSGARGLLVLLEARR